MSQTANNPMMRLKRVVIATCFVTVIMCFRGLSDASEPPDAPRVFDRMTVVQLIKNIEDGHNAAFLRSLYFGRLHPQPMPKEDAYALVKSAVDAETVYSKRWYVLASVQGYAAFRVSDENRHDGYVAYDSIFRDGASETNPDLVKIVQRAIYDYCFTISGNYGPRRQGSPKEARQVTTHALACYLSLLDRGAKPLLRPEWSGAISNSGDAADAELLIGNVADSPGFSKSYEKMATSVAVYYVANPKKALAVMELEKPVVLSMALKYRAPFYAQMVDLRDNMGDIASAIKSEREFIELSDSGHGRLAALLFESHDMKAYQDELDCMSSGKAPAGDLVEFVARMTASRASDYASQRNNVEGVLQRYCDNLTLTDTADTLDVRLAVAEMLTYDRKPALASQYLRSARMPLNADARAVSVYAAVQRMLVRDSQMSTHP